MTEPTAADIEGAQPGLDIIRRALPGTVVTDAAGALDGALYGLDDEVAVIILPGVSFRRDPFAMPDTVRLVPLARGWTVTRTYEVSIEVEALVIAPNADAAIEAAEDSEVLVSSDDIRDALRHLDGVVDVEVTASMTEADPS